MVIAESINLSSRDERNYYLTQSPARRAALAHEMGGEVLSHYDHARTLVAAIVTELRSEHGDPKAALHLATVTEAWLSADAHVSQESRLIACLEAMQGANHG
jgi:hypothetical protein